MASLMPSPEWQVAEVVVVGWNSLLKHSLIDALPNPPWTSPTPGFAS